MALQQGWFQWQQGWFQWQCHRKPRNHSGWCDGFPSEQKAMEGSTLCDLLCLYLVLGFYSLPGIQQDGANEFREASSGMWGCWLRLLGHPQGIWSFRKQWPQLLSLFQGGSDFPQCCRNLQSLRKAAQRAVLVYIDSSFFVHASVKDLLNLWGQKETKWKWFIPNPIFPEHKLKILVWRFLAVDIPGFRRLTLTGLPLFTMFLFQSELWICEFLGIF